MSEDEIDWEMVDWWLFAYLRRKQYEARMTAGYLAQVFAPKKKKRVSSDTMMRQLGLPI